LILLFITSVIALSGCSNNQAMKEPEGSAVAGIQEGSAKMELNGEYVLDTERSALRYHAEKIVGNSHNGNVGLKRGNMDFENNKFVNGEFIIDMTDINEDNNNEMFLNHIRSEDFFDIEKYPESKLVLTSVEKTENPNEYQITGDLTIKDKTNEIEFPAIINSSDPLNIKAEFEIDRTRWDVIYGSGSFFDDLGDKAIRNEIEYSLDLYFN